MVIDKERAMSEKIAVISMMKNEADIVESFLFAARSSIFLKMLWGGLQILQGFLSIHILQTIGKRNLTRLQQGK